MAPFDRRDFSGNAVPTTTTGTIGPGDLTINIALATGWPDGDVGPFIVTLDQGLATEEKVEVQSRTGLVLTIPATGRGADNTAAVGHGAGAPIEHTMAARDLAEANQHLSDDTLDHHSQYFTAGRHAVTEHAIGAGEVEPGSIGYVELAAGQRWEPGDFKWSMQTVDHAGWLKMDGRNTHVRATYAALFALVGVTLQAGSDGTTFGVGDVSKRIIMGKAAAGVGSTLGGTGGSANASVVEHQHTVNNHTHGGNTNDDTPDHAHNANHGHTADDNQIGEHDHTSSDGNVFVVSIGGPQAQRIPDAGSTSNGAYVTYTSVDDAGAHNHDITVNANNFNTAGATARHHHPIPGDSPGTNLVGVSGTDANLPPFLVMNGFIHA